MTRTGHGDAGASRAAVDRLWEALVAPPRGIPVAFGNDRRPTDWSAIARSAVGAGTALKRLGVVEREPVGCLLDNSREAAAALLGIWLIGGVVVSLPSPARGVTRDRYASQVARLAASADLRILLAGPRATGYLDPRLSAIPFHAIRGDCGSEAPVLPDPDDVAFVQYSSGSTGTPRGVALTPRAIAAQLDGLTEALALSGEDALASWLPFSHDMGLFGGLLIAWRHAMRAHFSSPERFAGSPRSWLDDCATLPATLTMAPGFALSLAARAAARRWPPRPLELRGCVVGGEQIDYTSLQQAGKALSACGLSAAAWMPAYGLAEATLAATIDAVGAPPRFLDLDPDVLRGVGLTSSTTQARLVSCGPPLPGVRVEIDGGAIGEIVINSPSNATGYYRDPDASARTFTAMGVRTGDLGLVHDGELYVAGRRDELLAVAGRNVFATDIERELLAAGLVKAGRCAVVRGSEGLTLVAEPARGIGPDLRAASRSASEISIATVGARIAECVWLTPGTFPVTPSGKVRRASAAELGVTPDGCERARVRVG